MASHARSRISKTLTRASVTCSFSTREVALGSLGLRNGLIFPKNVGRKHKINALADIRRPALAL
jgi:hypothetical protein